MNLIRIDRLPPKGFVIAVLRSKIIFEPYETDGGKLTFPGSECLENELPSECHFFDQEKEYRLVRREARNDVIERVLTLEEEKLMDPDLIYLQEMMVDAPYASRADLPDKLLVINRYEYSENDTLVLKDCRISW